MTFKDWDLVDLGISKAYNAGIIWVLLFVFGRGGVKLIISYTCVNETNFLSSFTKGTPKY
jgi:hypothetical protein